MYAAKLILQVLSIRKQDTTVDTVVMFVGMGTTWMNFELEYARKIIVAGITCMQTK